MDDLASGHSLDGRRTVRPAALTPCPAKALVAVVRVGEAQVGLMLVGNGSVSVPSIPGS